MWMHIKVRELRIKSGWEIGEGMERQGVEEKWGT